MPATPAELAIMAKIASGDSSLAATLPSLMGTSPSAPPLGTINTSAPLMNLPDVPAPAPVAMPPTTPTTTPTDPSSPSGPVPLPFMMPGQPNAGANLATTALANLPESAWNVGKNVVNTVIHPWDTAKGLVNTALGAAQLVASSVDPTLANQPQAQAVKKMADNIAEKAKDPLGTIVNDPVGTLMLFSGLLGTAGKLTSAARLAQTAEKLSAAADFIDPIQVAGKIATAGLDIAGKVWPNVAANVLGLANSGGTYIPDLKAAFKAGTGNEIAGSREAFDNMITGLTPRQALYEVFTGIAKDLEDSRNPQYQQELAGLSMKPGASPINIAAIRDNWIKEISAPVTENGGRNIQPVYDAPSSTLDKLKAMAVPKWAQKFADKVVIPGESKTEIPSTNVVGFDFSKTAIVRSGEQALITKVLNELNNAWSADPVELNTLKQRIGNLVGTPAQRAGFTNAEGVALAAKNAIDRELSAKVSGYAEMNKKFSDMKKFSDKISAVYKTDSANGDFTLNAIVKGLEEDRPTAHAIVQQMQEYSGVPLEAMIAGAVLSKKLPQSLFGKGLLFGTALHAGMGHPLTLALLPMTSPYLGGRLMAALGASAQSATAVRNYISTLNSALPAGMVTTGLTIGAVQRKLSGEDQMDNPITPAPDKPLYELRRITRGNTVQGRIMTGQVKKAMGLAAP